MTLIDSLDMPVTGMLPGMQILQPKDSDPYLVLRCATKDLWLQARRNFITASDLSVVFGACYIPKGKTLKDRIAELYDEKIGGVPSDFDPQPAWGRNPARLGIAFEGAILDEYAKVMKLQPHEYWRVNNQEGAWDICVSRKYPHLAATLDGMVDAFGTGVYPVECKLSFWAQSFFSDFRNKSMDTFRPPLYYKYQCLGAMIVTSAPKCDLVALVDGIWAHRYSLDGDTIEGSGTKIKPSELAYIADRASLFHSLLMNKNKDLVMGWSPENQEEPLPF